MYMAHKINPFVLLWLFIFYTFAKNKNLTYYAYKRYFKTKRINTK